MLGTQTFKERALREGIGFAIGQGELADGYALAGVAVEIGLVLQDPAGGSQQRVDLFAWDLFRRECGQVACSGGADL
jgi:hypothetical protein